MMMILLTMNYVSKPILNIRVKNKNKTRCSKDSDTEN